MSHNINYYKGMTLSKEELEYKDYADKYMSLYVDLIKSGNDDVIFLKNDIDFQMSKVTTTDNKLRVLEGYCLFNKIAETVPGLEYKRTMDSENFPNQKFFVKSDEKLQIVPNGSIGEKRYIYLKNFITPCSFKCTVASDGVLTILDGGSISKSEITSVIRNSASGAPTRVRFLAVDYSTTGINNTSIYEVNSFTDDIIVLNGTIASESGEVLCIPIGSFDLGVENNLPNRSLFSNLETKLVLDNSSTLDEDLGIIKLGYITFTTVSDFTITDLRNDCKYIITIDTAIDLSDFMTLSTVQTVTAEKYYTGLIQNKLTSLNYANNYSSGFIDINTINGANEFIFDFQGNSSNLTIVGFKHGLKPYGFTPGTNIIPGTSIKIRFVNVGALTKFSNNRFGLNNSIPVRSGVLYTMRYDGYDSEFAIPRFSISSTFTEQDGINIQNQVTANTGNISSLQAILNGVEFSLSTKISDTSLGKVYMAYIKQGNNYLVTIHARLNANINGADSSVIPIFCRPTRQVGYLIELGTDVVWVTAQTNGTILLRNDTGNILDKTFTYITPTV